MAGQRELWSRLTTLLDAVSVAVSGCGAPVAYASVVHGTPVWDECCEGFLYVGVERTTPTDTFPGASTAPTNCDIDLAVTVSIGILRCAPVMDSNGNAPSADELTAFTKEMIRDKSIIYNVLVSHDPDWAHYPSVIDSWSPLEIQGGCGGGAWRFYIDAALCECGPD